MTLSSGHLLPVVAAVAALVFVPDSVVVAHQVSQEAVQVVAVTQALLTDLLVTAHLFLLRQEMPQACSLF